MASSTCIVVKVLEGKNLIPCDRSGTSDPYVVITVGSTQKKTGVRKRSLNPNWSDDAEQPFSFSVPASATEVTFEVYDWNQILKHKRMGKVSIPIKDLSFGKEQTKWVQLTPHKEKDVVSGELHLYLLLKKEDQSTRRFMTAGPSMFMHPDKDEPPIFTAIKNSDLMEVLKLLKDPKLNINMRDNYGYTPLHAACCLFSENDDEILQAILKHKDINVNSENNDKNTGFHYFCQKFRSPNCTEAFELFIEKGADVHAQNNLGETPLHKAIFNNSVRLLMVNLLIKAGSNVNKGNDYGETALHYAVRLGREDLVSILLKAGADVNAAGGKEPKRTPYELAKHEKSERMAFLLKRAKDLFDWLDEIGMEKYKATFLKEEMYKDVASELDDATLDKLGITTVGHRVKFLKAAKALQEAQAQKKTSSDMTPTESVAVLPQPTKSSIEQELENLKYITKQGNWVIQNSDLEFAVKLGSGASGTVYKGLYKGAEVAIKVLKTEQTQKELEEFKKEFQIMSSIQSPYLVFFFGACLEPKLCMVMEFCGRGSLYHVMNDPKVDVTWDKVFSFTKEMVLGVDCLHNHTPSILHRDFKSLNLMVTDQFQVKVGDFGLARFNTETQKETLGKMRGTFAYCAPEVYFGEPFSTKADVFSIGVVMWEIIACCIKREYIRPYQEYPNLHFDFQIIIQTAKKDLRPTIPDTTPDGFASLIKACWSKDAKERPECKEIVTQLEALEQQYKENVQDWESRRSAPKPAS